MQVKWTKNAIKVLEESLSELSIIVKKSIYECVDIPVYDYNYYPLGFYSYLNKDDFYDYLSYIFGQGYPRSFVPKYENRVEVTNVNIYSDDWTKNYGRAYSYGNRFEDDFSCRDLDDSRTYSGYIKEISKSSIYVREDNRDSRLYLATCSVLQVSGDRRLPRSGDKIIWKGSKRNLGNNYSVRSAICM